MKSTHEKADGPNKTRADSARAGTNYEAMDSFTTKAAYKELDTVLDGLAEQVVHTIDQIIPHLAKMQFLLSQRGKARKTLLKEAGLPSWPEYGKTYADKLECSFRTIQDHITGLRRNGKSGPSNSTTNGQKGKPWHADAKDSRALAEAQLAINDLIAAYEAGADLVPAYQHYRKVAVSPTKLNSMLDAASGSSRKSEIEAEVKRKLVPVVETAERYIHALEKMVHSPSISLSEEQESALEKPKEEWRGILRFARGVKAERIGHGESKEAVPAAMKEVA